MTTVTAEQKPLTDKELNQTRQPVVKAVSKVHITIVRPLYEERDEEDPTKKHTKYGIVAELQVDPNNQKMANSFSFRGRMFELMIDEYAYFDKNGLGVVFYDIDGRRPVKITIDNIENQKSSRFAEKTWGKGNTLTNLIASIEDKKKGSALIYITMIIVGLMGGIIIDHFAHI